MTAVFSHTVRVRIRLVVMNVDAEYSRCVAQRSVRADRDCERSKQKCKLEYPANHSAGKKLHRYGKSSYLALSVTAKKRAESRLPLRRKSVYSPPYNFPDFQMSKEVAYFGNSATVFGPID